MHPSSPELQLGEWPVLPWADWQQTAETLQLFTQIVGIVGMPTLSNGTVKNFSSMVLTPKCFGLQQLPRHWHVNNNIG